MSTALIDRIEEVAERYPNRRSAIMPALFLAQTDYGHLSSEVFLEVAGILDVPEIWVYEIATFYSMFNTEPVGRFHIQVCDNVSCLLRRANTLVTHLEKRLGISKGETTPDGLFSLCTVECLGSCDTAPVLMVNDTYHEGLDEAKVDEILDGLTAEAAE